MKVKYKALKVVGFPLYSYFEVYFLIFLESNKMKLKICFYFLKKNLISVYKKI